MIIHLSGEMAGGIYVILVSQGIQNVSAEKPKYFFLYQNCYPLKNKNRICL